MTVRMLADMLNIGKSSLHTILNEHLGLKNCVQKLFQSFLHQTKNLEEKSGVLTGKIQPTLNFLERVITGDKSWFYEYDLELKSHSIEWKSKNDPQTKKYRKSRSKIKVM